MLMADGRVVWRDLGFGVGGFGGKGGGKNENDSQKIF